MSSTADAVNRPSSPVSVGSFSLLCACFVLSGIAALVYQTAWTRQFAIVFGTSELAVATVLAAYMGGLAAGAWLAQRFLPRVTRPVFTYALLELGIAIGAVAAEPLLSYAADAALQTLFGGLASPPDSDHASSTLFYLVSAFVSLALPTTLMGATLPILARHAVAEDAQIGRRIGVLYAMNTAGAVAGALVTAFVLLPELGLQHTVWVGASFNGIACLLAFALSRRVPRVKPPRGNAVEVASESRPSVVRATNHSSGFPGPTWVLPLMLVAGAVAFFQEVLWTRMLSHIVGSSIYAFGVMIASFLTGIALGGALGAAVARNRERAALALAWALIVAAAAAAAAYLELGAVLPKTGGLFPLSNTLFSGLLLLPMTLAIGMTYPLAVRVLASDARDAAPASARVYAWNTFGAIVGSLAGGFLLIPALRYEGAIRVAVCASAALGIAAAWVLVPVNRIGAIAASLLAIAGCVLFRPEPPLRLLMTSPLNVDGGRIVYYDIGRSASVVMLAQDGGLALRTNGLPEALMDGPGSLPRFSGENWLSPLAVIARPQARDMLIVGFGGGGVVEGIPPSVRNIDVIELEPKVIEANRLTSGMRKRNPLDDPRLNIIVNDARGALRLTTHRYDAIVSQPSHPWTAGASHLYTREFMQLAHDHLTPDGVFVQWMNLLFMDEDLLRSLTATMLAVFSEVRVYRPDPNTVVLLASDKPLDLETELARSGSPLRDAPLHYARFGINTVEDLVEALELDTDGARALALGAPLITDDDNRIATSSVYERGLGLTAETSGRLLAAHDPLQRADSIVYGELEDSLSFPYLARRSSVFSAQDPSLAERVARMARILGEGPRGEYLHSFYFRMLRQSQRANELLRLAIDDYPTDESLRLEFLRPWFNELAIGAAPTDVIEVAGGVTGAPVHVLAAARHAAKSEWRDVALADSELATIPWTSVWYAEALELRVNWRIRTTEPTSRKRYGDEAVLMIDRLAIMNPTLNLFALRTQAGLVAGRPAVVIESLANYAHLATGMIRARVNPPESFRKDAQTLSSILDGVAALPGADAARIAEVRGELATFSPK